MVVPYLLVFVIFVLYPVCYGLWLARHRRATSTDGRPDLLQVGGQHTSSSGRRHNLMLVALVLSGFFVQTRWWIKILRDLHPPVGGAVDPTILSVHFMLNPSGRHQQHHLSPDGPRWAELAERPALALCFAC
jgi:multiple sugar transport system permease protein